MNIFSEPMAGLSFIKDIFQGAEVFNFDEDCYRLNRVPTKTHIEALTHKGLYLEIGPLRW